MDYTSEKLSFQIKKVIRYVQLYGVRRTLIKIKGRYHSKRTGGFEGLRWVNPACKSPGAPARNVAIIGCGNYAFSNIGYYLAREQRDFLKATYDIDRGKAVSLCREFRGAYAAGDWREILADPAVKLVFIASNHASHAEYAIAAIEAGKHVHIEKPHVVSVDQLARLAAAMHKRPESKVFLGFNRPKSGLFRKLAQFLAGETGPLMINWFVAGHYIEAGHWYYNRAEGGRILGNLCHWTDLTLHLAGMRKAFPCTIVPSALENAQSDYAATVVFADGSCAAITFSAKGHAFLGVREILNLQRANIVASLTDFQTLRIDRMEKTLTFRPALRDHGHGTNIANSLRQVRDGGAGEDPGYIVNTARFFLAMREAIEEGRTVTLDWDVSFDAEHASGQNLMLDTPFLIALR